MSCGCRCRHGETPPLLPLWCSRHERVSRNLLVKPSCESLRRGCFPLHRETIAVVLAALPAPRNSLVNAAVAAPSPTVFILVLCFLISLSFVLRLAFSSIGVEQVNEVGVVAVPALVVTGILVYIGSFSIRMGAIPWVVMSEIFPVNIKGQAGSVATLTNWFGAWLCSYTFNFLMSWSSYGTFIISWCLHY